MGLLKNLVVTLAVLIAACSPASEVSTSETQPGIATSTTDSTPPLEFSACDLATEDEVARVVGEVTAANIVGEATSECRWTTNTGGFEENEVVIQISLSTSAMADLEVLRGAMDLVDESGDLGEDSFIATWGDEGTAHVAVSDDYLVTVASDAPGVAAQLRSLAEQVLSRLP